MADGNSGIVILAPTRCGKFMYANRERRRRELLEGPPWIYAIRVPYILAGSVISGGGDRDG